MSKTVDPGASSSASGGDNRANGVHRRDLMKLGLAGLGAAVVGVAARSDAAQQALRSPAHDRNLGPAPAELFAAPPMEVVRVGYVGVGGMGSAHVRNLLGIEGAEIRAVCDLVPDKIERIQEWCADAGQPIPTGYARDEYDFIRMCEEEDLDLVYTATPWRWHVPVCVAAMENGKHAATEVPAAVTIDECWQLVETAEKYQKHCLMMENCNYDRNELMVLNMVRQGVLGEVLHGECGYLHDLRGIKFADEGEGLWRRAHSIARNGNLYPTHGLGPIMQCMDIDRGDRMDYLVSMSSPSRGLQEYARENFPPNHMKRQETYRLGDVNTSMIMTALGRTIYVSHDTNLPRPYSRIHMVQGTKGLFQGYPPRVYIEGRGRPHAWIDAEGYDTSEGEHFDLQKIRDEFDHPLFTELEEMSRGAGHGGMDFIEDYRLIKCLREGLPTDFNVYESASISAVCELSEISVANGGQPVEFPDFTRGRWKSWPQFGIVHA